MRILLKPLSPPSTIDPFKLAAAIAIALCCLCAPRALAKDVGQNTNASSDPILSAQLDSSENSLIQSGIQSGAVRLYLKAAAELRAGKYPSAEKDALRAVDADAKFADAYALAATAALAERQFARAREEAGSAVRINENDEKAWVILATANNYLAEYDNAIDALHHVREEHRTTWQVAYQWTRAEAGLNNAADTLEWAARAALTAPSGFAPLHLLHASALLAAGRNAQAADELATYLRLLDSDAPQRAALTRELKRIRASTPPDTNEISEYNALRN